jgi:uncharacterized protein Smg (DUF494 family)
MNTIGTNQSGNGGAIEHALSERDFKNCMIIVDFCLEHDAFPNMEVLKEIMNELLLDYEYNALKLKADNQELFIKLARRVFKNEPKKMDKVAEISIKYIKTEATSLRYLCNGLELFEALDIVKHESRRLLLGRIKSIIDKDEFKIKELLYLIQLYPNKIRTRAFE